MSSGYKLIQELIADKYPPCNYNIYVAQASDGDNFTHDDAESVEILGKSILPNCNMFVFIGTQLSGMYKKAMLDKSKRDRQITVCEYLHDLSHTGKKVVMSLIEAQSQLLDSFIKLFTPKG